MWVLIVKPTLSKISLSRKIQLMESKASDKKNSEDFDSWINDQVNSFPDGPVKIEEVKTDYSDPDKIELSEGYKHILYAGDRLSEVVTLYRDAATLKYWIARKEVHILDKLRDEIMTGNLD